MIGGGQSCGLINANGISIGGARRLFTAGRRTRRANTRSPCAPTSAALCGARASAWIRTGEHGADCANLSALPTLQNLAAAAIGGDLVRVAFCGVAVSASAGRFNPQQGTIAERNFRTGPGKLLFLRRIGIDNERPESSAPPAIESLRRKPLSRAACCELNAITDDPVVAANTKAAALASRAAGPGDQFVALGAEREFHFHRFDREIGRI